MRLHKMTVFAALLGIAGCEDSGTGPAAGLTVEDAASVAVAIDGVGTGAVDAEAESAAQLSLSPTGAALDVLTRTGRFDLTRDCPRGGTGTFDGERTVRIDTGAGHAEMEIDGTATFAGCAFETRRGVEVTVTGALAMEADREMGRATGFSGTQRYTGSLHYTTDEGASGTCAIDVTTTLTAGNGAATRQVTGTFCGTEVDQTTNWAR